MIKKTAFGTRETLIGEMAHIVSETTDGPRGKHALDAGEHNKYPNLMLLCANHHTEIDAHEEIYTVEKLLQMKADHEAAIERAITRAKQVDEAAVSPYVSEAVYSTLLPVARMPRYIFSAPCKYSDGHEKEAMTDVLLGGTPYMCPFIIRDGGVLYAFNDLRGKDGPFQKVITRRKASYFEAERWLEDSDKARWFVTLLNRTLNKLTGRKGLQLDREHHRYYFKSDEAGKEKSVEYRPLNQSATTRKVVWQPMNTRTNQPRNFWNHLAVNLQFLNAGSGQWCFCIRPELRVTRDGVVPIESRNVGRNVTRQMSHQFNYDLLEDVNFWRDFLSEGQPRIIMQFGPESAIIISTTMMSSEIEWPGIPKEFAKPFENVEYEDNLFTAAKAQEFETEESEPLPGEDEVDDDDSQDEE